MVLIEAMSMGVPIAGFNVPGANEVVSHLRTALLVQPGDTKGLAASVLTMCKDKDLYQSMSNAGQKIVAEKFSAVKNAGEVERIYKQAIKGIRKGIGQDAK